MGNIMNEKEKQLLYQHIRENERIMGASRLAILALNALIKSIRGLKCQACDFRSLYMDIADALKNAEPEIVPLNHLLEDFETEMEPYFDGDSLKEIKKNAQSLLEKGIKKISADIDKVIIHGGKFIEEDDLIIVHTASSDIIRMLVKAKTVFNKNFKVLLLKQDFVKTRMLIDALSEAAIPTTIIPEYSLGHYIDDATKLFIGASSITKDKKIICAPGTRNIASLCYLNQTPIYLFTVSLKFSHLLACNQKIHVETEKRWENHCVYVLTAPSHDTLDFSLATRLVTEKGTFTQKEAVDAYFPNS